MRPIQLDVTHIGGAPAAGVVQEIDESADLVPPVAPPGKHERKAIRNPVLAGKIDSIGKSWRETTGALCDVCDLDRLNPGQVRYGTGWRPSKKLPKALRVHKIYAFTNGSISQAR